MIFVSVFFDVNKDRPKQAPHSMVRLFGLEIFNIPNPGQTRAEKAGLP
jgi:hypothetical protein